MKKDIAKAYMPQEVEEGIYREWERSGYFNPDNLPCVQEGGCEKFVISMPPPNATGILHIGHGCRFTYQDLMTRFYRLRGKQALWVPGTDHASIATQTKVEKIIAKEGFTKYDLGREKFLEKVQAYVEESRDTIRNQVRRMGSSCDWSRERYTLDEGLSEAVKQVFVMMYADGLIYRGDRVVNWCPRCESTIADDEVEYREGTAKLYYFRYSKDFPIVIATTRPETKLGDTAVAVNPKDERYKEFIGKSYRVDLGNGEREIRIISDWEVDMAFGTGALGVTPAHSLADFKMAKANELPIQGDRRRRQNDEGGRRRIRGSDHAGGAGKDRAIFPRARIDGKGGGAGAELERLLPLRHGHRAASFLAVVRGRQQEADPQGQQVFPR
jgi:valyl-tRNA synthetase